MTGFNLRHYAKKDLIKQADEKQGINNIMTDNYGKGNLADGVLKLLLSSESLNQLDTSLVNLHIKAAELETSISDLEHRKENPKMFKKSFQPKEHEQNQFDDINEIKDQLKEIKILLRNCLMEMGREKENLLRVHMIYTDKFKGKINSLGNQLNQHSKQVLMDSLMVSHNKSSVIVRNLKGNFGKNHLNQNEDFETEVEVENINEVEEITEKPVNKSYYSQHTTDIKSVLKKVDTKKRNAILKSLQTRQRLVSEM